MTTKYIIQALRAMYPTLQDGYIVHYLCAASEYHRKGFQLPALPNALWYAFTSEPLDAIHFESKEVAEAAVALLLSNDNGWFRPLTILEVYQ